MGEDKTGILIDGVPQAQRIADALGAVGLPVTVLGREPIPGHAFLRDANEFAGPLSALAQFAPSADAVFVCSCDLPLFDARIASTLAERLGDRDASVPQVNGFRQPLCALYRAKAFAHILNVLGQVGQLFVAQRAQVAANAPIMTVVDLGAFELEINVPDSFARDIGMKMPAEIRSGATRYAARVRSVSPEVVNGNVATRLEFVDKRPEGLRQNQRLTARILIEERRDVLKIERGPFVESGGGNAAYFVDGKIAARRPITIGALGLDAVEIVSGARLGDEIVIGGSDGFQNAQQVRIAD